MKALNKEYPDKPETSDDGEDIFITWQEKLERMRIRIITEPSIFGILIFAVGAFFRGTASCQSGFRISWH